MNTLTIKQKRVIENNNVTVENVENGYIFLIAGCFNQQKPKRNNPSQVPPSPLLLTG
jgi:hypothetical protein